MATSLDNAALLTMQAIYHNPKRAEWTTQEYITYHILVTWYASVSHTQVEKLCKLQEVYYAMGYYKDFEMYLADSKFELPRMKKGGNRKQSPVMGVAALSRHNSFPPNSQVSSGPNGKNTVGKRILDANGTKMPTIAQILVKSSSLHLRKPQLTMLALGLTKILEL